MDGQDTHEQHQLPAPRRRALVIPVRGAVAVGGLVIAAAVGILLWQFVFTGSGSALPGIHLKYPSAWSQVSPGTIKGAPSNAVAALLRKDKRAVIIVARSSPMPLTSATALRLEGQLKAKYPDFKPLRAQIIQVAAGKALLVAYERTKQGRHGELHTVTIVPAGRVSYVLESASPAGNARVDHELQAIIVSAQLVQP
jgi:hypothetical protein